MWFCMRVKSSRERGTGVFPTLATAPPGRSFLRWAGSKRQLLPTLRAHWHPSYRRYIEPFAGSAALFFDLMPSSAVLADTNDELVLAYIQVKENL